MSDPLPSASNAPLPPFAGGGQAWPTSAAELAAADPTTAASPAPETNDAADKPTVNLFASDEFKKFQAQQEATYQRKLAAERAARERAEHEAEQFRLRDMTDQERREYETQRREEAIAAREAEQHTAQYKAQLVGRIAQVAGVDARTLGQAVDAYQMDPDSTWEYAFRLAQQGNSPQAENGSAPAGREAPRTLIGGGASAPRSKREAEIHAARQRGDPIGLVAAILDD